jgi:ankyrin repeat protein
MSQRDRFKLKEDEREEMKSYIRDPLNEAVVMGDYYRTTNILERDMTLIVSGEYPIIIDKQNEFGRTQLLNCGMDPQSDDVKVNDIACKKIAKLLKKHGAKMNHVDKGGWDALSLGAIKGYTEFCRYLLKSKLKVDRIDREGKTAAMKAASLGFTDTLYMLVNEGNANMSISDKKGMSTLHHVTQLSISNSSYIPFLSSTIKLINNASLHVDSFLDFDNRTPLMYSVSIYIYN